MTRYGTRFAVFQHVLVDASDFIPFFPIHPPHINALREKNADIDRHRPPRGVKEQKQQQQEYRK
jgi:hypothetical protein